MLLNTTTLTMTFHNACRCLVVSITFFFSFLLPSCISRHERFPLSGGTSFFSTMIQECPPFFLPSLPTTFAVTIQPYLVPPPPPSPSVSLSVTSFSWLKRQFWHSIELEPQGCNLAASCSIIHFSFSVDLSGSKWWSHFMHNSRRVQGNEDHQYSKDFWL